MAKKPAPNPVTTSDEDAFAMCVHKWQTTLNLLNWRIERDGKPCSKASMAEVSSMSLKDRLALYRIGEDFGNRPVTEQSVDEIACHEVLHVFLCELIEFSKDRGARPEDIDAAEHSVINTLVRLLVPEAR
jgi:hypothetical protein